MTSGTFRTSFADFVNEIASIEYPEDFDGLEGMKSYAHHIGITKEEHKIALSHHRQAFNEFLDANYDSINSPTQDMILKGCIRYPRGTKLVLNMETIWNFLGNDMSSKSSILQHLVVISYFSTPKRRFNDVDGKLEEISKVFETVKVDLPERDTSANKPDFDKMFDRDDEVDEFIRNTIGKLFKKGMNTRNPMQTITNLMKNPMALKGLIQGNSKVSMKRVVQRLADVMPD